MGTRSPEILSTSPPTRAAAIKDPVLVPKTEMETHSCLCCLDIFYGYMTIYIFFNLQKCKFKVITTTRTFG